MRRTHKTGALVLILFGLMAYSPGPAKAAPGKCETWLILDPACEVGKSVKNAAGDVLSAPVKYAAGGAVDTFTSWVADAAQWALGRVVGFMETSTTPTLDAGWFVERYEFMVGMGALILLPMLVIATIRAVISQDMSQLLRSFFVYLPVAICGTFAAVTITQSLLVATDALSASVARNVAGDVSQIFDSVGSTLSGRGTAVPSFAIFFGALLLVVGAVFVWLELLVRSAAVTVAVFFLPMVLAGLVWPAAMHWTKKLVELLVALIISKFVIVAVISLATAALAEPGKGGFGTVMGASALMLMAAFSPFAVMKLIPMVEGAAIGQLQGTGRSPIRAMSPQGGVGQTISMMRAKTSGSKAAGLAMAGAGVGYGLGNRSGVGGCAPGGPSPTPQTGQQSPTKDSTELGKKKVKEMKESLNTREDRVGGGIDPSSSSASKPEGRKP